MTDHEIHLIDMLRVLANAHPDAELTWRVKGSLWDSLIIQERRPVIGFGFSRTVGYYRPIHEAVTLTDDALSESYIKTSEWRLTGVKYRPIKNAIRIDITAEPGHTDEFDL